MIHYNAMRHKVLDIQENGVHLICIRDDKAKVNPYRLYKVWYDEGWHRKQEVRYADFLSIMHHIHEEYTKGRYSWAR